MQIPNNILRQIYETDTVLTADGGVIPVRENVAPENAEGLYRAVLSERPRRVLEVGMANGITSLAILTALDEIGEGGKLTSIDPYQSTDWQDVGVLNVDRAGFATHHELRIEPDYLALPSLLADGGPFDFAYLDGWHNFDYTLIDFFFADKLLRVGGVVAFNDCDWKPVVRVLRFVERHRKYRRLDFGLPARWGNRTAMSQLARRALDRLHPGLAEIRPIGPLLGRRREDRYYRKVDNWEPPHGFWVPLR